MMIDFILQASSLAAAANSAALEEMDRKLKRSDGELGLVNKRLDEAQGKPLLRCMIAYCRILTFRTA